MSADDWRTFAACRGGNTALWFPHQGESSRAAKAICEQCPVAAECGTYARTHREPYGIWGGQDKQDRSNPIPRRRVAPCGTESGYYRHRRTTHTDPCEACIQAKTAATAQRKRQARQKVSA